MALEALQANNSLEAQTSTTTVDAEGNGNLVADESAAMGRAPLQRGAFATGSSTWKPDNSVAWDQFGFIKDGVGANTQVALSGTNGDGTNGDGTAASEREIAGGGRAVSVSGGDEARSPAGESSRLDGAESVPVHCFPAGAGASSESLNASPDSFRTSRTGSRRGPRTSARRGHGGAVGGDYHRATDDGMVSNFPSRAVLYALESSARFRSSPKFWRKSDRVYIGLTHVRPRTAALHPAAMPSGSFGLGTAASSPTLLTASASPSTLPRTASSLPSSTERHLPSSPERHLPSSPERSLQKQQPPRAQTQTRQRTLPYLSRDADRRGIPPWHVVSTTSLEAPAPRMPAFPPSPVLLGP